MWRVWGEILETSDLSGTRVYQPYKPNKNIVIIGCRVWIVVYNDPSFTDLNMKIYSNDSDDAPEALLATSTDVRTKSEIITDTNGVKEIYFNFNNFGMQKNDTYNFVLNGSGYTGSSSSHLAWMRGYPDPVHRPNGFGYVDLAVAPFALYTIGADL